MWEHADKPPKGRDYGLKTYKVIAVPRNEKEMNILQTDHNAWVGLPIAFTPFSEYVEEKRLAQRKTMSQLEFTTQTMTPYGHPVVPLSPLKSKKPVELMLRLNKESYAFATAAEKEMTAALKHQAETETEEDRRLRLKASKFNDHSGTLRAIRSRKWRLEADQYFTRVAEEGDDEQELEEDLFATGSVLQELEQQRQQQQYESDHPNEYKVSKGVVRRGARKPLSKSQRNALREKAGAGARVQVYDTESGARLNVTSKYDVCAAHLSVEEPRLKWLQELARQNNYSASQREYVKLRNQFIHKHEPFGKQQQAQQQQSAVPGGQNTLTNTSNGRVLTITKGTHRDGQGMVRTNSAWGGTNNSSTWGKIKSHVQSQMDARHAATDITARQKRGRTLDPSEFIHNMIGTGVLESDVDAYISVWGRQVYKPPKEIKSRARVWAVRPRQHYKLRYTWLPQPMLRPAVGKVFAQTHVEEEDEQQDAGDMFGGHIPVPRKKKYSTKTWYPVELNESDSAQEEEEDEEEKQKEEEKDEDGELKGGGVSGLTGEFSSSVTVDDHGRYIGSVKESPEQRSRRILSVSGLVDEDTIATMHINQLGTISLADGEGMESSSSQLLHVQQSAMLDDIQALSDWTLYADRNNNSSSNSNDTPAAVAEDSINSLPLASTKLPKEPSQSLRTTSRSLDFASDDEMNMNINAKKKASGKIMTPKPPMQAPPPHLLSNKASTWAASSTSGKSVAAAGGVSRANISPPQKHKQVSSNNTSKQPSPPRSSRSPNRSPRQSPPRSPTLSPPRTSARSPPRSPSAVPSKSLTPYSTSRTSVAGSSSARFASSFISLDSTSPSAAGQVEEQEAELERAINATADVHTGLNNIHNVHTKVKTPSFKEFVQSAKLKPYHKLERSGGTADQPYEWH